MSFQIHYSENRIQHAVRKRNWSNNLQPDCGTFIPSSAEGASELLTITLEGCKGSGLQVWDLGPLGYVNGSERQPPAQDSDDDPW